MRGSELLDKMELVDPAYVEAAGATPPAVKRRGWVKWGAVAACLCVLIGTGALAAEAYAYHEAAEFFNEYGLSTEGLTRGEIKEVYRDITARTFSYSKTADVLQNSVTGELKGTEISQDQPTPEEVEALWRLAQEKGAPGVHYQYRSEQKLDEDLGFEIHDRSYFEKYDGETLLWSVSFTEFFIEDYAPVSGGVLVWGCTPVWASSQPSPAWLAKVDDEGNLLWKKALSHGFDDEYIAEVVENGDGTCAVFSRGDLQYLVLSQYTGAGEELSTHKTQVGNQGIWNAARLGEDYIVQLGNRAENVDRIVKVDRDGNVTDAFTYTSEACYYYVTDMAEFAGKLYLSAYSVPRLPDDTETAGGRYEVAAILKELFDNNRLEIGSDELTGLLRDHYTAVLLLCDPKAGTPQTFYSVQGSLGGKLTVEGEELLWDVESFSDAIFSPATSAYSIAGTCQVFRYSFDRAGSLLRQEKTDEVTRYSR